MIYLEQEGGSLSVSGMVIPPIAGNRDYDKSVLEVSGGLSTVERWSGSQREVSHNSLKATLDWKESRSLAVSNIKVIVDSMEFDGDEVSQGRMARAVTASSSDSETTTWTLANNTPATVTALQLKRALKLSGLAQTGLWMP